jgi:hypothetical protein
MAAIVDRLNISVSLGANTGQVVGDLRMGRPKHLLLTNGAELTNADLADSESLQAWLEAKMALSRTDPTRFSFSPASTKWKTQQAIQTLERFRMVMRKY